MSQPREFWIAQGNKRGNDFVAARGETRLFTGIHVIEKDAYDELVKGIEHTKDFVKSLSNRGKGEPIETALYLFKILDGILERHGVLPNPDESGSDRG